MNKALARIIAVSLGLAVATQAQDRLPHYPGYDQYQKMSPQLRGNLIKSAALETMSVNWTGGGTGFDYQWDGKSYHFDIAANKATETSAGATNNETAATNEPLEQARAAQAAAAARFGGRRGGRGGGRGGGGGRGAAGSFIRGGQQMSTSSTVRSLSTQAASPDGKLTAFSRDGNLFVRDASGGNETAITTEGSEKSRVRYGVATIIYGEELGVGGGIFWSPDSKKIAYYRFDESEVRDYVVLRDQVSQYDRTEIDPYPKAGVKNAVVDLYIYDVETKKSVKVDIRDGKPFEDDVLGYYVYRLYWSPDGKELLFHRMNRKQNSMDFAAANPETGKCRVIIHEEWKPSWVEWMPMVRYLEDGNRFLWTSERNGFRNFQLYDMSGKLLAKITDHPFEVANVIKLDEEANVLFYMARDGDNYMKLQFHRVNLDGKGDRRLTDPAFNHSVSLAPDNQHFIDTAQTHDAAPVTRLLDADGKVLGELAKSDTSRFEQLGLKRVELFKFKANDGQTDLYGMLNFPSNFDPNKKYPLLVSVYGGPITTQARETFSTPNATTEYGFLVASFDARSGNGRGRKFSDAFAGHLGIVEMDDHAAGVRELIKRSYVNKDRIGVFGTSYGGTTSATLLMRFPDLFHAASSSSPVTDYRNYNAIYGERYNGLVSNNKEGYDAATVMTYVPNLKGRLLLYFGTADNNVHVSNSLQLIRALQQAGKSFELQIGPDLGHTGVNQSRMMEFFIENLVLN